ncbi:MAG: hypothetical protein LUG52_03240 [Clostridia bacterium]|nr:hypothetical protein [Clostridia bacterium]
MLEYDDLEKIIAFLNEAERTADKKIAALQYGREKIRLARADYENKLCGREEAGEAAVKELEERVILLSEEETEPSLDNLWNYHSRFYEKLPHEMRERFAFEDLAGIYIENGKSNLFAVCIRYEETEGIKILPKGKYLCADCTEETREERTRELADAAVREYGAKTRFVVQQIVISGILQWKYHVQVFLG